MMGHQTISPPGFRASRLRNAQTALARRRFTWVAVALSVGVHVAAALLVVLLPQALPRDAPQQEQGTVELLMIEQKGAEPSQAGQPKEAAPTTPTQAAPPQVKDKEAEATARKAMPTPPASPPGDEAVRPPVEQATIPPGPPPPENVKAEAPPAQPPSPQQAKAQPDPPKQQEAPVFNLEGTDSESNAIVLSSTVLPAMKDDRFRNRPPIYPVEAQTRGQSGAVVLVIHVSENGLASAVDVLQSSGVDVLDKAAVTAVQKWRFHPAMKEGRSIPSDMPFRFIFEPY